MYIEHIRSTPNPSAIVFEVDATIVAGFQSREFQSGDDGPDWIQDILELDPVKVVMVQQNQMTVRLDDDQSWEDQDECLESVVRIVRDVEDTGLESGGQQTFDETDEDPKLTLIRTVLEQEVVPYLQSHGGDIQINRLDEDDLYIEYKGACGGCPASITGTLQMIEKLLRKEVDPDLNVKLDSDISQMMGF